MIWPDPRREGISSDLRHILDGGQWPALDRRSHTLTAARRMESFTDIHATSKDSAVQIAADSIPPPKMGGIEPAVPGICGSVAWPDCVEAINPTTKTSTSAQQAAARPGIARF